VRTHVAPNENALAEISSQGVFAFRGLR